MPIFSIMCPLAEPIIHILFERFAFDSSASALVSSLFLACEYQDKFSLSALFIMLTRMFVVSSPYSHRSFPAIMKCNISDFIYSINSHFPSH